MNMNLMRVMLVACSAILIPNVASAYYAAHMGRWTSRDPIADRIGGPSSQEPSAFPGYMGRYTTRDPFDEIGRIGTDMLPSAENEQFSLSERRPPRGMPRIRIAGTGSDVNLYEYALDNPLRYVDPSGLQSIGPIIPPDRNCFYYEARCKNASWWNLCAKTYYCAAARAVCNFAGDGGWRNCMRECLQCRDGHRRLDDTPILGTAAGCLQVILESGAGDHTICAIKCIPKVGSHPPAFP